MIGIVLAGGTGTRLWPLTLATSKQLLPIYDKPMIYYPLSTLVSMHIRDIVIVTTQEDHDNFTRLLGDGSHLGLNIRYVAQSTPRGIADAFIICADYITSRNVTLILGDNIFHGVDTYADAILQYRIGGANIYACRVSDPTRYGVVEIDDTTGLVTSIEEKPASPKSSYAVPGLYLYDSSVVDIARSLRPSARGELEITDVNEAFRQCGSLRARVCPAGSVWLDAGTFTSLAQASEYVRVVEERSGVKIGCLEESAWRSGFIDNEQLDRLGHRFINSSYGHYVLNLLSR